MRYGRKVLDLTSIGVNVSRATRLPVVRRVNLGNGCIGPQIRQVVLIQEISRFIGIVFSLAPD
jgi:hypothetical protein